MRYYIRQKKTYVSGPHELDAIRTWIRAGKVRPDMEFSLDGREWMWGIELVDLFPREAPSARRRPARRRRGRRWRP